MSDTPRTDRDDRPYPLPEHAQRIQFEGCECVVMAPEDYESLYEHARQLERELAAANKERDDALMMLGVFKLKSDEQRKRIQRLIEAGDEMAKDILKDWTETRVTNDWTAAKEEKAG